MQGGHDYFSGFNGIFIRGRKLGKYKWEGLEMLRLRGDQDCYLLRLFCIFFIQIVSRIFVAHL